MDRDRSSRTAGNEEKLTGAPGERWRRRTSLINESVKHDVTLKLLRGTSSLTRQAGK